MTGFSPLHFAAFNGNPQVVEFLIRRGSKINLATDKQGFTPLHLVQSPSKTFLSF
jgi:ankyrin repeat protein